MIDGHGTLRTFEALRDGHVFLKSKKLLQSINAIKMFRLIFLGILILTPEVPSANSEWICNDPSGCPIVENTCPTCTTKSLAPKIPQKVIHTHTKEIIREKVREVIREVAVPSEVFHIPVIPPTIVFSNPKVHLAALSFDSGYRQWKWSAKVSNFTCVGTRISSTHNGTFRCNGESTKYFITFF